ncbi:hypothetical protein R6Q57_009671 [Mikania cordata]
MMRRLLNQGISSAFGSSNLTSFGFFRTRFVEYNRSCGCLFASSAGGRLGIGVDHASEEEANKVMRLVDVEALKMKLGNEVVHYKELLQACTNMGVMNSVEEAKKFAKVLDEDGVIFMFGNQVHLHPHKVLEMVRKSFPLTLMPEDDPRKDELKKLKAKQEEIDVQAHKQVQCILWAGFGLSLAQASLFFRLTFWEFSWDVMEPITFFTTSSGLILGYAYFLLTSKDPSYQDLMKRLFLSRRRKLIKKHNFDVKRFMELQKKCISPLDAPSSDCKGVA